MPSRFPALRVDHVSIAVRAIAPALAFLGRHFPIEMGIDPRAGYDDQFVWTDFLLGDWKLELIESARPGSFVERFLNRRGEGFHHLSLEVEGGTLDAYCAALQRQGLRIVDRGDYGGGDVTAFISPRTAPGILVQFWQVPGFNGASADGERSPVAERDGVRYRVDHVAVAVRSIDETLRWFESTFPVESPGPTHPGWDGTHTLRTLWLAGFKMELLEPRGGGGPIARFLERRGEGFHHLTIDVDRLDRAVGGLESAGVRVIGRSEVPGGHRSAFIHPHDAHGVLIQLWEPSEFGSARRR